jgi:zinc finger protein
MRVEMPCPACGAQGIDMSTTTTDVPYFGECVETLIMCRACGFKHTDLLLLDQKDPARFSLQVDEEAHLFARVVRSPSGTIRIPEMGVLIEPGPLAESFVTNVEGILNRVERVLGTLSRSGEEERRGAEALMARIDKAKRGEETFTLILEDPFGNSAILHPEAVRTPLSADEAKKLKTGMTVLDLEDLAEGGEGEKRGKGDDDEDGGVPSVDELLRP